jgi:Glycosyl transferase family 2
MFAYVSVALGASATVFASTLVRQSRRNGARHGRAAPELHGKTELRENGTVAPKAARHPTVSVVIPALNEEASIDWVLRHMPSSVSEVVLVDGLSTDLTEAVARRVRPDIIVVHQHQRGKGAALRAGFAAARGDIIAMLDADGSTDPRELERFLQALEDGADFVKGSRSMERGGSVDFTALRQVGNGVFVLLVNFLYRSRFTDLCYGYCAFWRRHLDGLALTAHGFEIETQLVLNALNAGLQIREVPSYELARRAGSSNLRAFRDGRSVLATILRDWTARHPRISNGTAPIELLKLDKPSLDSDAWLPAGHDRRRHDRRQCVPGSPPYTGPERRRGDRRRELQATSTVYVARQGGRMNQDRAEAVAVQ